MLTFLFGGLVYTKFYPANSINLTYRIGQQKNVIAVRLISPDTVEEKMMKMQESKKELVQDLIKTDGGILKALSKKDLQVV